MKYLHVSTGPNHSKGKGVTYNVGRNKSKRIKREAARIARAAAVRMNHYQPRVG